MPKLPSHPPTNAEQKAALDCARQLKRQGCSNSPAYWTRTPLDGCLAVAVEAAERELDGTPRSHVAVVLEYLREVLQAQAPSQAALSAYIDILEDVPPDLLRLAGQRVLRTQTYRTLPLPAEILKHVESELGERRVLHKWLVTRQKLAQLPGKAPEPAPAANTQRRGQTSLGAAIPRLAGS